MAQRPQPMQRSLSTLAKHPLYILIAWRGHTCVQAPQETHLSSFTTANLFIKQHVL